MHGDCECVSNIYFKQENLKSLHHDNSQNFAAHMAELVAYSFRTDDLTQKGQKTVLPGRR
jgi:hypothetical protein